MNIINYKLISTDDGIIELCKYFYHENITKIAMDFEGEFNLHSYGEKLCLIQVFDGLNYYIIDPFEISKEELIKFFEYKHSIKIMYGAESDVSLIYSQYGILLSNIFDLKIVVDIMKLKPNGLDNVLKYFLNIEIKDKHKYQYLDWTKRPVVKDAIQYALNDVAYLLKLNEILMEHLRNEGKYEDLIYMLIKRNYFPKKDKISAIFKKKEFKNLSNENKKIFKNIHQIREFYSKEYNIPPFKLIDNNVLFDIVYRKRNVNEINLNKIIPIKIQSEILEKIKNELS